MVLAERVSAADEEELTQLYLKLAPALLKRLNRWSLPLSQRQDLVQEAFTRLWQHWEALQQFRAGGGYYRPWGWLALTADRLAIDALRQRQSEARRVASQLQQLSGAEAGWRAIQGGEGETEGHVPHRPGWRRLASLDSQTEQEALDECEHYLTAAAIGAVFAEMERRKAVGRRAVALLRLYYLHGHSSRRILQELPSGIYCTSMGSLKSGLLRARVQFAETARRLSSDEHVPPELRGELRRWFAQETAAPSS